ncbi:hypothetical protein ACFX2J_009742 [Malus domestica]
MVGDDFYTNDGTLDIHKNRLTRRRLEIGRHAALFSEMSAVKDWHTME